MSEQSHIQLLDRRTRTGVDAVLIHSISEEKIAETEVSWQAFLEPIIEKRSGVFRRFYVHWIDFVTAAYEEMEHNGDSLDDLSEIAHWQWQKKKRDAIEGSRVLGIECDDKMQGLMLVRTDKSCRLTDKAGQPLVYVDNIATAPWNQNRIAVTPRFSRIGFVLIAAAIELSQTRGWNGRIGLHALPNAVGFYRKCSMVDLGEDDMYGSLRYFEMSSSQAQDFLGKAKL